MKNTHFISFTVMDNIFPLKSICQW